MGFRFFENGINSGAQQTPNDMYRDIQQEFLNMQFDNTSAKFTIQEQDGIGLEDYHEIEVWLDSTVADTTTGLKDSNDFLKLYFQDIDHRVIRGLMYKFDNNYWIVNNYSKYSGLAQQCGVRRCNNRLKIIDPLNGKLQVIPCCVDYDMTSPSAQTSRYIITPNNHATVIVQGNELNSRLFTINKRFVLSGRPFKLLAYQNAVEYSEEIQQSTLVYLDLYLDEIHDGDDLINDIADNGEYNYSIKINADETQLLPTGATGRLKADVALNGQEVSREIIWASDNSEVITVDELGNYVVTGENGDTATIIASISGNSEAFSEVSIQVADAEDIEPQLVINPLFDKIKQYDTIDFTVQVEYGGQTYTEFNLLQVELIDGSGFVELKNNGGYYSLTALKVSKSLAKIRITVANSEPLFNITQDISVQAVSMMG